MGAYADRISKLKLHKELKRSAGRDDLGDTNVDRLVGMIAEVADLVGPVLERIPQTFGQYTKHDIEHSGNVIDLMGRFIPNKTLKKLNAVELGLLLLSGLLHDVGMAVSVAEKQTTVGSEDFERFRAERLDRQAAVEKAREDGNELRARAIEDALLAEYYRRMHPERARKWIERKLAGKLNLGDNQLSDHVATLCESHGWGVRESNDPRDPDKAVRRLEPNRPVGGVPVNMQYLACCLRLGDIMDFDRSRTPLAVFEQLEFTEDKSWEEWNKHLAVSGWSVKEREVMFSAPCDHPVFYVAVQEFLDGVDAELRDCRYLIDDCPRRLGDRYLLHVPHIVDRRQVGMRDKQYVAGAFRFQLEYEDIVWLLRDKSLYPDPSLFLRELLQNSLDACRRREASARAAGQADAYEPRIVVWDHTDDADDPRIVFQDNGVGMSRKVVEEYFMRVGKSYYRSPEFLAERNRLSAEGVQLDACSCFGIGIVSCFLVADRFEVETYQHGYDPLHIDIEGPAKYFVVKRLARPEAGPFVPAPQSDEEDGPPNRPGTRITVHLRSDAKGLDAHQVLDTFAVNVDYDVRVYRRQSRGPEVIPRLRWQQEVRLGDFPESVGEKREWSSSDPPARDLRIDAAKNLEEVVVAEAIPLKKWGFSRHLRGRAWFWLLHSGQGGVCAGRGYLRMTGQLKLVGLPDFLRHVWWSLSMAPDRDGRHRSLLDVLGGLGDLPDLSGAGEPTAPDVFEMMGRTGLSSESAECWNGMSRRERQGACDALSRHRFADLKDWRLWPGLPAKLLEGGVDWVDCPVHFGLGGLGSPDSTLHTRVPDELALNGIRLPAGIVNWRPARGESEQVELLPIPGGIELDARGPEAPAPAANRLFVHTDEGPKIVVPYLRAALRHGADLVAGEPHDEAWRDWFAVLSEPSRAVGPHNWTTAWNLESAHIEERVPYVWHAGGEIELLTKVELVERCGRWVPLSDGPLHPSGVYSRDSLNRRLLACHPQRQRDRGILEVDMETLGEARPEVWFGVTGRRRGR